MRLDPAAAARPFWGRTIVPGDLRHDANIFTMLRCLLASAVIFSHAFKITGEQFGGDPTRDFLPFPISGLAVQLFFSLSGFLVTGSLMKRGVRDFVVARALRLIPGLWVMLAVTTVVLGFAFNAGSFVDLLQSPSLHRYFARNMVMLGRAYNLDGIFATNPMPDLINGSLWTIRQEVRCYVVLGILGGLGLLTSRGWMTIGYVVFVIMDLVIPADAVRALVEPRPLAIAFFFGVLLYLWRDRVWLSWALAVAVVVGALLLSATALHDTTFTSTATSLAFSYAMLVVAFCVPATWKRTSAAMPDYSYGIYIYAFPAQQAAVALGIGTTPYANAIIGFLLTLPFAAASWHLVEKPALTLKSRWTRRLAPAATAAAG